MESKDRTKIRFINGMRTIGGTFIEVTKGKDRIIFDCGAEFHPELEEQPQELEDILECELAPFIEGIYDKRIELSNYKDRNDPYENTAIFVSHIHLDHSKMINFIDPSLDVYMSNDSKKLLEAINEKDFLYENNFLKKKTRAIKGVEYYRKVQIGKISVTMIPVDHDCYGAVGFIIQTDDLKISYTGDIRLHGFRQKDTIDFIEKSKNSDYLISEGVSVSFNEFSDEIESPHTEDELIDNVLDIIDKNPNRQITFSYYISNIERILKLIEKSKRQIVLDSYYAYVLKKVKAIDVSYYDVSNKDYGLREDLRVDIKDLLQDKKRYLRQFNKSVDKYIDAMLDGGIYLHLDAEPLGEFDPYYEVFIKRFEDRNIEFKPIKCSGHAYPKDLLKIINGIKPRILVPIHSFRPEKLFNENGETILPMKNQILGGI